MKHTKLALAILSSIGVSSVSIAAPFSTNAMESLLAAVIKSHPELTQKVNKNKSNLLKTQGFANTLRYTSAYKEGRVIVRLKAGESPKNFLSTMVSSLSTTDITTVKSFPLHTGKNQPTAAAISHLLVLQSNSLTTKELINQLSKNLAVDIAEPDYYVYTQSTTPNDNLYPDLWGMNNTGQTGGTTDADIDAPEAWDRLTGNGSAIVGIIDTGIDYNHPDLVKNLWRNIKELNGVTGADDDGNGYTDDIYGIDTVNGDSDPLDDNEHGTHVAGTISGVGNNTEGVAGVAWNTKLAACKFLDASGSGPTSGAIECLNYFTYLKNHGENIVATNNSWSGGGFDATLKAAIDSSGAAGTLFIAAAGNSGTDNDATPSYPASYDSTNIIAVAATDHNDALAGFSQYGATSVDLAAPGVNIKSSVNGSIGNCDFAPESAPIFHEGFEVGFGQWSQYGFLTNVSPPLNNPTYWWKQSNAVAHTGTYSASDSLNGNYLNYEFSSMTANVNLSATAGSLCGGLWLKGETESGYDHLLVYLSKDGGVTWTSVKSFSGVASSWTKLTFAIPDTFKTSSFLVAVVRTSDVAFTYSGYEVDDVGIGKGTITYTANYAPLDGTSMATPHVSGAVALAAMAFPSESVANRKTRVLIKSDLIPALVGKVVTGGRLNVANMVAGGTDNLLRWPDFNSDAKYDIVWRNYSTGTNVVWNMDGITRIGSPVSLLSVADVNWKIAGTPDMNGDGKPDILWRHHATGSNVIWYMNGVNRIGSPASLLSVADVNWRIVGTPDMNGDGKPDILWRHNTTGQNIVWFMDGINRIGSPVSLLSLADVNLKIVGTPDLNDDGKPDLLWRNYSTGANSVWYMNGINRIGNAVTIAGIPDTNWKIVATPDINRDGKPDILWRHSTTGANYGWYMNGVSQIGAPLVLPPVGDTNWKIVNNGNF